jgi:type III secretion system FlhB-like substrate exporter
MSKEQKQLLESLIEKASNYDIDVTDNSMLPDNLKKRKSISFTVKPPTMEVLAKCAIPLLNIPEAVREAKSVTLEKALEYRREMAEVFAIIAHGKNSKIPDWYADFILNNVTGKELFYLFQETALKLQSDFFLNSFQIAKETNPMMMNPKT